MIPFFAFFAFFAGITSGMMPFDACAATGLPSTRLAGEWAAAQKRNADRLAAPPLDRTQFILDDVTLHEPRRKFAEYSGDISGRWIGVAAFLEPKFPKDFTLFPSVLSGFSGCQKSDGHFGAGQQLPRIERKRDMPILWGNGRLLVGLIEVYEQTGNAQALSLARKLGNYFLATDSIYDQPGNITKIGGNYSDGFATCYFSCIEGLADLAKAGKSSAYLEESERIAALALSVTNFEGLHCHGRLTALRGIAEIYSQTKDPRWLSGIERDWKRLVSERLLPTGGFKEVLSARCIRDEGCAEADWLRLNLDLFRMTGQGGYLDAAQRCLWNHFRYQQFPNGGAGHRFLQQVKDEPVAFKGLSEEAWWCCGEHWGRALVDLAGAAVTATPDRLNINLGVACVARIDGPGGKWKASIRETSGGFNLQLNPPASTKAEVRIHRPAWARQGSVTAPKYLTVRNDADAWVLEGLWRRSESITVHFAPQLREEATRGGGAVLLLGYDLLAAAPCPANQWLTKSLPSTRPVILWSEALPAVNGGVIVPASLDADADEARLSQWHPLALTPLRKLAEAPGHQVAWFSFAPRKAAPEIIAKLLAGHGAR